MNLKCCGRPASLHVHSTKKNVQWDRVKCTPQVPLNPGRPTRDGKPTNIGDPAVKTPGGGKKK